MHQTAQAWLISVAVLGAILLALLHPKVFYPITNSILRRIGKDPIERRLRFRLMMALLVGDARPALAEHGDLDHHNRPVGSAIYQVVGGRGALLGMVCWIPRFLGTGGIRRA